MPEFNGIQFEWDKPSDASCMLCYSYENNAQHYWIVVDEAMWRKANEDGYFTMLGRKCIVNKDADYWKDVQGTVR